MREFHVLPTEQRFQELFFEQKKAIYDLSLNLTETSEIKFITARDKYLEELMAKPGRDYLGPAIRKVFERALVSSGLEEEDIIKQLDARGEVQKQIKIDQERERLGLLTEEELAIRAQERFKQIRTKDDGETLGGNEAEKE